MGALFFRKKNNTSVNNSKKQNNDNISVEKNKKSWKDNLDWPRFRIQCVIGFFCLLWMGLWGRAWYLQMIEGPRLAAKAQRQHIATELVAGKRGLIYDRNGQILARSVQVRSVYAMPGKIEDFRQTAGTLAPLLNISPDKLQSDLEHGNKKFMWLKRKIDDRTAQAIRAAGLAGIGLSQEYDRFYPFKHMAGQVLGFVGMDDKGLEGIERSLDGRLGSIPVRQIIQRDAMGRKFYLHEEGQEVPQGEDVTLTLDMKFQFIAEEAVAKVAREWDARWSGALIVDIQSGDILAWAQYPFFNPNAFKDSSPQIYRNRLAADALEPGSTFKPLIMAAALQSKKVTPNTLINCEGGRWEYKNFTIRDTSTRGILPASKVLRYSSNIGMAKIGMFMGARELYKYLNALGFGQQTNLPIANSKGIIRQPKDWGEMDVMAAAFGQSVSVTGLQMAQAYLTLLNDGMFKPLRLVMGNDNVEELPRRIFHANTVFAVKDMMRDVVQENDGTGKKARVDGAEVGGKTGTAQKADEKSRTYGSKRLASFVGFFPVKQPRYLILVLVDEPSKNQFGGIVAAPAFKEIASKLLAQDGMLHEVIQEKPGVPSNAVRHKRGLMLASAPLAPWVASAQSAKIENPPKNTMQLPGHLAKASSKVPDVMGKSVRNAVELFARAGVVPELKGNGTRVVRQSPPPGTAWPNNDHPANYILWLSEK